MGDRFVDLPADGPPEALALRLTPCVDPEACGDTPELQASLALEGGDMLHVYVIDRHEGPGEQYLLVTLRERPERSAFTATVSGPPRPGHLAFYPDAEPTSALDAACILAEFCIEWTEINSFCKRVWGQLPASNPARQKFMRAGSCEALREAWPDAALLGTPGCVAETCVGEVFVTSCAGDGVSNLVMEAYDCGRGGATCHDPHTEDDGRRGCFVGDLAPRVSAQAVCDGDVVRKTTLSQSQTTQFEAQRDCAAEGLACLPGAEAFCGAPCSGPVRCEDNLGHNCFDINGDGTLEEVLIDCADYGGRCAVVERAVTEITCDAAEPDGDCSGSFLGAAWTVPTASPAAIRHCLGHYLAWCANDRLTFIDCTALGGTGCTSDPYGSACQ